MQKRNRRISRKKTTSLQLKWKAPKFFLFKIRPTAISHMYPTVGCLSSRGRLRYSGDDANFVQGQAAEYAGHGLWSPHNVSTARPVQYKYNWRSVFHQHSKRFISNDSSVKTISDLTWLRNSNLIADTQAPSYASAPVPLKSPKPIPNKASDGELWWRHK